nr:ribonuclease H-like domain-containing protein [Tanacetum cinerariifolium]
MQKRKNGVKARTTLLLSLPDEHQLRFSKYKTAPELWAAVLKTFNAEGSETLEQTFNILQVIIGQLQFMDVEIEQDDLNQKFLTSLAPEWLMHMIVWRNRSDLDTMSLDDLYNYLKVYESEVQKKSEPNPQNMAFISSAKHSRGNDDVNTASVSTASTNIPTASANIRVASISQDIACTYIASQSSASGVAKVPTGSGSIPTAGPPTAEVPTGSDVVPTAGPISATATVVTPYTRRKGKETMVESETLKKKKIQEQMDIQMARQLEEKMERDA